MYKTLKSKENEQNKDCVHTVFTFSELKLQVREEGNMSFLGHGLKSSNVINKESLGLKHKTCNISRKTTAPPKQKQKPSPQII